MLTYLSLYLPIPKLTYPDDHLSLYLPIVILTYPYTHLFLYSLSLYSPIPLFQVPPQVPTQMPPQVPHSVLFGVITIIYTTA